MVSEKKALTWKQYFSDKNDEWLKDYALSLHLTINVIECFGTHDVIAYQAVLGELEQRGYEAVSGISFRLKE